MTNSAGRIFISYRRKDSRHVAGRLADRLEHRYGIDRVFMDVDILEPGVDFAEAIDEALTSSHVLIALIGPEWLTMTDVHGNRRIDDPDDLVVLEVGTALARKIRVIPVLIDEARMPVRAELPDRLQSLARRHAARLNHETFRGDVDLLLKVVDRALDSFALPSVDAEPPPNTSSTETGSDGSPASSGTPERAALVLVAADAVRDVKFSKPPIGKRGYNEDEVDMFLELVETNLRAGSGGPSADDVHNVAFSKPPAGKRGYNEDEVDVFLDRVEETIRQRNNR